MKYCSPNHFCLASSENRHRWEQRIGHRMLYAARIGLVFCLGILPFLWGGRHAFAVGFTGLCLLAVFLCWISGTLFKGSLNFQPAKGTLVFILFLYIGLLQLSPWFSGIVMDSRLAEYWQLVRDTGVVCKNPVLAVLPDIHRESLLTWASAAVFYLLSVQLFAVSREKTVLLAMVIASSCGVCGLISLIQHFGGYDRLFWVCKDIHSGLSGPYFNKNHFAQLQCMGLFTALGLILAVWGAKRDSAIYEITGKTRLAHVILWGSTVVICAVSVSLSLSRAGILCAAVGLAVFLIYMLLSHFGKRIILPVLLILLPVFLVSFYGLDRVILRLETALSGEDFSWLTRREMWRIMSDVIALSPWWGTGFGSVRALAPLFDLSFIPGFVIFDAHNDYLELIVTFGMPLGVSLLCLLAVIVVGTVYRLADKERRRSSLHPVSVGIFLALLVAGGHEFFDYGLKQSANLLIFLALAAALGGMLRAMGGQSRYESTWKLGRVLYIVLPLILVPVLWLGAQYGKRCLAGAELVRLQTLRDVPEVKKAFPPATRMMSILGQSGRVLKYAPEHPEAIDAQGMAHSTLAWLYRSEALAERLGRHLDRTVSKEQVWRPQYRPYLEKAFLSLEDECRFRIAQEYGLAAEAYTRMANANPMSGLALSALAQSMDNETAWKGRNSPALAFHEAAYRLYPYHTVVLQNTLIGYCRAWQEEKDNARRDVLFGHMLDMAQRLGKQNPQGMDVVYPILWQICPDSSVAQNMTSDTIQGQEALAKYFTEISHLPEALAALDRMEQLNRQRPEQETPETMGNPAFLSREKREKALLERIIVERKIGIMERMGEVESADKLRERVKALRYTEYTLLIQRVDALINQGEYFLAEEILKNMQGDGRAYVRHAEILFGFGRYEQLARVLSKCVEFKTDIEIADRLNTLLKKCKERKINISTSR